MATSWTAKEGVNTAACAAHLLLGHHSPLTTHSAALVTFLLMSCGQSSGGCSNQVFSWQVNTTARTSRCTCIKAKHKDDSTRRGQGLSLWRTRSSNLSCSVQSVQLLHFSAFVTLSFVRPLRGIARSKKKVKNKNNLSAK